MHCKDSTFKRLTAWPLMLCLATVLALTAPPVSAQEVSNRGKEFIMTFLPNLVVPSLEVHLTGADTQVTVEYPMGAPSFTQTVDITSDGITIVQIPNTARNWVPNSVGSNAVRAFSEVPFVAYMHNLAGFSSDSSVALPVEAFNTEYLVATYTARTNFDSHFVVVAAFDNTTVQITPTAVMGTTAAGSTLEIVLNRGQAFFGRGNFSGAAGDLTGTLITASRPVGMTSGNNCANIPTNAVFCDTVFQVAHPTQTWGKEIPVTNLPNRSGGSIYRILAAVDGTEIRRNGVPIATLDRGQFHETGFLTGSHVFSAEEPIFVVQFMTGISSPGAVSGDPAMGNMIPNEQYLEAYTFATVGGGQFASHFLTIIAEESDVGTSLVKNGEVIDPALFSPIAGTSLLTAIIPITEGVYTTASDSPHGITVQGFNDADSYLYPGGARFEFIGGADELPPICDFEISGNQAAGSVRDDREGDSGVFIVRLLDGAQNVQLAVEPFTPGDPVVFYTLNHLDTQMIGFGTVEGVDGSGNRCTSFIEFEGGMEPPGPDPEPGDGVITVLKFFDANADGVWNPETEPVLEGWKMTLSPAEASTSPAEQLTDAEGIAFWEGIDVEEGPFFVEEGVSTIGTWIQSSPTDADGNPVNPAEVGDTLHVEFGNYCLAGSNGRTLGFWSNPNGRRIVDASNGDYLDLLSGLNLRDARGERFQPTSSHELGRWLLGADATNMAYMLSAQAAAMALNLAHGFVDGNAHDVGYGASVSVLLGEANALLSADLCGEPCVTESGNALRPDQEFVKDALDRLNSGGELVPTTPCEFGFEED